MKFCRAIAVSVIAVFVLVTGMAPLAICCCCDRHAASAAGQVNAPDAGEASETCCSASGDRASTVAAERGADPTRTIITACSCDAPTPKQLDAVAADGTHVPQKLADGHSQSQSTTCRAESPDSRMAAPALVPHSHTTSFLANCSFLC